MYKYFKLSYTLNAYNLLFIVHPQCIHIYKGCALKRQMSQLTFWTIPPCTTTIFTVTLCANYLLN